MKTEKCTTKNVNNQRVLAHELCREVSIKELEKITGGYSTLTQTIITAPGMKTVHDQA